MGLIEKQTEVNAKMLAPRVLAHFAPYFGYGKKSLMDFYMRHCLAGSWDGARNRRVFPFCAHAHTVLCVPTSSALLPLGGDRFCRVAAGGLSMSTSSSAIELRAALEGLPVRVVDVNGVWPTLRIGRTVPLGRLEWLWTLRGSSVRDSSTSAKACFNVVTSATLSEPSTPQLAHEWFRRSYLHVMLVTIQELQVLRESPGWSRVRTFVDVCREYHLEYLVICVADDTAVRTQKKVLDKLRADVNLTTRGRERVVTVPVAATNEEMKPISHLHHSPAHQDLLVRLRECARDGVEVRVQAYEAEASRSHASRSSAAWSFSSYFSLKEGMSFVFVQIGRRDLALKCYDELAAIMTERNERGTRGFCASNSNADTAIGVVDPYAKEFRRMIIDNDVTELDFRTYLFARQTSLLLVDRKYSEVAERGLKFITAVARRAAEEAMRDPSSLSLVFRDAWVFRAARALAAALAPAIPSSAAAANALTKQLGTARERHTARLIAGFHVHALKAFSGLAQLALPGTLVSSVPGNTEVVQPLSPELKEALASLSNDMLHNALSEPAKAVELYSEMANAAASLYEMGGRARGAAALDGDAGVVSLRNSSLVEAEELLSAQCSRFTEDHGWDQLHRRRRVELANAEKSLNRVQEYLVSCLTMLFMTRGRRRLGLSVNTHDGSRKFYEQEAARWAKEAQEAAGQLPRIMKYKAEKLFVISMRVGKEHWNEGDAGSAVVVIESDIPTDVVVDSLFVDLRWAAFPRDGPEPGLERPVVASSALHRKEGPETMADGSSAYPDSSTSADPSADFLVLRASDAVTVRPGTSVIEVGTQEIPRSGRYTVGQVSLVIGRLKLVQSAAKAPTIPTVTTRGSSSAKVPSAALAASAAQADLPGSGKVRFPCYFAYPRPDPATVHAACTERLYLLPGVEQRVPIVVKAGPNGIAEGSCLRLNLPMLPAKNHANGPKPLVEFVEKPFVLPGDSEANFVSVTLTSPLRDSGEVVLTDSVEPDTSLRAVISLRVCANFADVHGGAIDSQSVGFAATLVATLVSSELKTSRNHKHTCSFVQRLAFVSPLLLSAHIELNPGTDELPVSQLSGGEVYEAPLSGGGQLLCSLRSCAGVGKSVTVKSASLELPPWLQLFEDGALPHESLLPCRVKNNGLFSVAFATTARLPLNTDRPGGHNSARPDVRDGQLKHFKSERTLSRLADQLDDIDIGEETHEIPKEADEQLAAMHDPLTSSVDLELSTDARRAGRATGGDVDFDRSFSDGGGDRTEDRKHSGEHAVSSLERIDVHSETGRGTQNTSNQNESPDSSNGDAGDDDRGLQVGGNSKGRHGPPSGNIDVAGSFTDATHRNTQALGAMDAILCLDIEVDGVPGPATLKHAISMGGLRPQRRRYRIQRSCILTSNVGDTIAFSFQVSTITPHSSSYDESSESAVLHYEVDADPSEWMLVGRRRGQMVITSGEGDLCRISVIPLTAGRLFLPTIKLYERDGCPLSTTRYENVDKGNQVTCLPSARVVSLCTSEPLEKSRLDALARGGGLRDAALQAIAKVTTVSSDSLWT